MEEFKLKYEKLNCDRFYSEIIINHKNSKEERLFDKIITPKNFKNIDYDSLISMKCALKEFAPVDPELVENLANRSKLIQEAIDAIFEDDCK
ncbi:hypothetical protein [uncultured Maribacter sp.]|uniref:hypothetical protein n=1 Tax=uncultured Maribacter sp. TaxID=431308 RepID=UPI00260DC563|nr:hypothetical protein [uncultured Maribacter sp.]